MTAIPPDWLAAGSSVSIDARTELAAALSTALAPCPVFDSEPAELVTPCVFVGVDEGSAQSADGVDVYVVTFPVVAVADGTDRSQVLALSYLGDRITDLARTLGATSPGRRGVELEAGGPRLRGCTVQVDFTVYRAVLCGHPQPVT